MKFAAHLTVSGIIGFIILEALKILMPAVTAWFIGMLFLALKILLFFVAVALGLGVLGLGIFLFKRAQRADAEA